MYQRVDPDKVLQVVKRIGPCVPNDVRKALGLSDTIVVGATLSELLRKGLVATTNVRKGASALYYDPANPASLEKAAVYLNEKDNRTFQLLKREKVLGEHEVDPLTRVSLRLIKDFAKRIAVQFKGEELVFWRYFLLPQEEALVIIKKRLGLLTEEKEETGEAASGAAIATTPSLTPSPMPSSSSSSTQSPTTSSTQSSSSSPTPSQPSSTSSPSSSEQALGTPIAKKVIKEEGLVEKNELLGKNNINHSGEQPPILKKKLLSKKKEDHSLKKDGSLKEFIKPGESRKENKKDDTELSGSSGESPQITPISELSDPFQKRVRAFFHKEGIIVKAEKVIRKGSDIEYFLLVPTPLGMAEYYCRAKSKKKSNEGDLSSVKMSAISKNLPAAYITAGEITKKARKALDNELKGILVKEL